MRVRHKYCIGCEHLEENVVKVSETGQAYRDCACARYDRKDDIPPHVARHIVPPWCPRRETIESLYKLRGL